MHVPLLLFNFVLGQPQYSGNMGFAHTPPPHTPVFSPSPEVATE